MYNISSFISKRLHLALSPALAALLALAPGSLRAELPPSVGSTRIAHWKDDRAGVFLLMFDDSWPSHCQVAAPELAKRGLTATFYICAGKGEYKALEKHWTDDLPKMGMVYGDHTMTHKGVKDFDNAEWEIGECAKIIRQIEPGTGEHLVSFALPGVPPDAWNITKDQLGSILKEHHLIDRPPFAGHGAVYHLQTLEQMLALVDKAITNKSMEYMVVHGVERVGPNVTYQDMWPLKQSIFLPLLDGMKERSDKGELWVTDHISEHQYDTERNAATVESQTGTNGIQVTLKCTADPVYYNLPLTLVTQVPPGWDKCQVTQGKSHNVINVQEGRAIYDAQPDGGAILLSPAS